MKKVFTTLLLIASSSLALGNIVEGPGGTVTRNDTGVLIVTTPMTEKFSDGGYYFFPATVCFNTTEGIKIFGGQIPCHSAIPFPLPKGLR